MRLAAAAIFCVLAPCQEPVAEAPRGERAKHVPELTGVRVFAVRKHAIWSTDGNGAHARRWCMQDWSQQLPLAMSPDAFMVARIQGRLQLLDKNGERADLGALVANGKSLAWSGDGRKLAFATFPQVLGDGAVWIVDDVAARTPPRRLTADKSEDDHPAFSPDGRWLALANTIELEVVPRGSLLEESKRVMRIEIVDLENGRRETAVASTGRVEGVAWSPDGRHLAFASDGELTVVPMAGNIAGPARVVAKDLRRSSLRCDPLAWRPDGRAVLGYRTVQQPGQRPQRDALVLAPIGGGEEEVVAVETEICSAAFDPSGQWIFVACGDRSVRRAHVASGTVEKLEVEADPAVPVWCRAR